MLDLDVEGIRYAVYQAEYVTCYHFQGYIELDKPQRMSWLRKIDGLETAHFEVRKGTREQARAYCMKEDSRMDGPFEFGLWIGGQGERSDLEEVKEFLNESKRTELELAHNFFGHYVRYNRALLRYQELKWASPRSDKTELILALGVPGCGKTRWAFETYPDLFNKQAGNKWWDGYAGQETVLLDDFANGWFPYYQLLQLADRYPMKVEVKGGTVDFVAKRLIITSNKHPLNWYDSDQMTTFAAFARRVDKVLYWDSQGMHSYEGPDAWDRFFLDFPSTANFY